MPVGQLITVRIGRSITLMAVKQCEGKMNRGDRGGNLAERSTTVSRVIRVDNQVYRILRRIQVKLNLNSMSDAVKKTLRNRRL